MKNMNKQIVAMVDSLQDQQLPKQWQALASRFKFVQNRLNLVEQTLIKLNKKVLKVQKNLAFNSENQKDLQRQFKQKLSQMVQILTDLPADSAKFQLIPQELNRMRVQMGQIRQFKDWSQEQIKKMSNFSSYSVHLNQIQELVKSQIEILQQKMSYFVDSKMKQFGFLIKELKQSQQILKTTMNTLNSRTQQNSSASNTLNNLNTSTQSKYSSNSKVSQAQMCHSKSSSKVSTTNIFQNYHPTNQICSSPKQYSKCSNMPSSQSRYQNSQYNNCAAIKPPSNHSKVVNLRQKLKQFQEINKKYEIMESETPKKHPINQHKSILSSKNKQIGINDSNHQRFIQRQKMKEQQGKEILKTRQKQSQLMQPNVQKRLQAIRQSMEKTSSVNKLKNIKSYLEQTQSQIDESNIMEPYYK